MAEYSAPTKDQLFALEHIAGLGELATHDTYSHADFETVGALLEEAGRFMSEQVAPLNRAGDTEGLQFDDGDITHPDGFADAYSQFVGAGWNGMAFSPDYGGGGLPWCVGLAVQEMLTSANMSFSLCPLLTQGAIDALIHHADESLQQTYLPKMISGEWSGTMNLTEPHAGSDVGALTTKAVPQPDGTYRLFGTKIFITYGEHNLTKNIIHLVLARTPDSPAGTRGISLFLVPKFLVNPDGSLGERNDLRAVSTEHKIGIHASPTCVMSYGDNEGAIGYLVGPEHGGMNAMFTMMNNARLSVGLQGLALAERSYQQARDYAIERKQGRAIGAELPPGESSPIVDHVDVRRMLMTMRSNIEAMRGVMIANAAALDRVTVAQLNSDETAEAEAAAFAALLTPISKAWGTDLGVELTSIGVQVHGGMGYVEETGAGQHWRDSRIAPIYEGTNGIQAADLAFRKLPQEGGAVMTRFVSEMSELATELSGWSAAGDMQDTGSQEAELQKSLVEIGQALAEGVDNLSQAALWLGGKLADGGFNDVAAGATPFARLSGVVVGGYYLAVAAKAAAAALTQGGSNAAGLSEGQLADKIATALYYSRNVMPEAKGLQQLATDGAETMFAIPANRL